MAKLDVIEGIGPAYDENFTTKFKKDPIKAVEEIVGIDLPDE